MKNPLFDTLANIKYLIEEKAAKYGWILHEIKESPYSNTLYLTFMRNHDYFDLRISDHDLNSWNTTPADVLIENITKCVDGNEMLLPSMYFHSLTKYSDALKNGIWLLPDFNICVQYHENGVIENIPITKIVNKKILDISTITTMLNGLRPRFDTFSIYFDKDKKINNIPITTYIYHKILGYSDQFLQPLAITN